MSWLSKFTGLPTLTDIPDAADSYAAGVFSIDTATSLVARDWTGTGGNTNAPRAYVDLAGIGTGVVDEVLRITGRCSAISVAAELNIRRGIGLYDATPGNACLAFIVEPDPNVLPNAGSAYGRAEEAGVTNDLGPDALTSCAVPNQFRLYWNAGGQPFEIPDAGFASYVVPIDTCSYWYSEDDGTTWVRVGDRAIGGGVVPSRAIIWAGSAAGAAETLTVTFTDLSVDEFDFTPTIRNKRPEEDDTYHDVDQNLYLEVVDLFTFDVDDSTVEIWLGETPVWTGDAQQSGFTVTKTLVVDGLDSLGWSYDINPDNPLTDGREYKLRAYAENTNGTPVDEEWFFKAGDLMLFRLEDQAENHPGAAPQATLGFQDADGLGATIEEMIGGVDAAVDMAGPPGKASFILSYNYAYEPVGPHDAMGFADYDNYEFYQGIGGPENFFLAILKDPASGAVSRGSGISIQGPLLKQAENFEDPSWHDQAGFADGMDFPQNTGGRTYHNWPREGRGRVFYARDVVDGRDPQQEESGFQDGTFYAVGQPHDYMDGVEDGDTNEVVDGFGIQQVQAFETDADDWATPAVAGFYGFSKEGILHHNGLPTLPGNFGPGAGQFNRRGWSDNQGLLATGSIDGDAAMIAADTLRIASAALDGEDCIRSAYRWWLPSDFEVTIDFASFSASVSANALAHISVLTDGVNGVVVGRRGDGNYVRYTYDDGSITNVTTVATSDTSGSFKLARVGTTWHAYYWNSGWVEIGAGIDLGYAGRGYILIANTGSGAVNVSMDWSNFTIASGGWTNVATWAAEAFSTERGNLDEFPDKVLAVGTDLGLDIIDTDTDLLWTRFIKGTGRMLHNDLYHPLDSAFKDGILVVAGNADANDEGSITIVDFNLDAARIARSADSAVTGGFFGGPSGGDSNLGRVGVIAHRNLTSGYDRDFDRWSTGPNSQYNAHNAVDLLLDSGKVYIVGGSKSGLSVFRYTRWDTLPVTQTGVNGNWVDEPDTAWWLTTGNPVYWTWFRPQDDMLFWTADDGAGETEIYSQTLANLELPMHGGNFLAGDDKTMPGTRQPADIVLGQHRPAVNGSDVYVAADAEVWKMTWPGGSWVRFLGKPSSGSTYEVLPETLTRVTSVRHMKDGSIDLLAVGVDTGLLSQVLVFRLDIGSLYAKTKVLGARSNTSLGTATV